MGVLYSPRDEDVGAPSVGSRPNSDQSSGHNTAVDPWLVIVIVAGILIILTLAIFMLIYYVRTQRQLGRGLFESVEKISSIPFSHKRKPSDVTTADRQMAEDLERDMMIRKSLASRPNSASIPASQPLDSGDGHPPREEHSWGQTASLKDWKAWEAHPGAVGLDRHPAFAPYLAIPQPTRTPSPRGGGGSRPL